MFENLQSQSEYYLLSFDAFLIWMNLLTNGGLKTIYSSVVGAEKKVANCYTAEKMMHKNNPETIFQRINVCPPGVNMLMCDGRLVGCLFTH